MFISFFKKFNTVLQLHKGFFQIFSLKFVWYNKTYSNFLCGFFYGKYCIKLKIYFQKKNISTTHCQISKFSFQKQIGLKNETFLIIFSKSEIHVVTKKHNSYTE